MTTRTWHYIKETEAQKSEAIITAANRTLTWTVDKNGDFTYTDMGDELVWNTFCERANI